MGTEITNLMNNFFINIIKHHFLLDIILTDFISYHFVPENSKQRIKFVQQFLDSATFSKKAKIFKGLVNEKYSHLLEKDNKLIKKINDFGDLRNDFAHSFLDTDLEFIKNNPDKILIKKYKDGVVKPIVYPYVEIVKKSKEASEIYDILNDEVIKMREFSISQEALHSLIGKGLTPPTK